ncbi:putative mRNA 3-end processing factor [bacterium A37T11]|nr:putative mRNA 3-end processing factor [bacterium A37T11]
MLRNYFYTGLLYFIKMLEFSDRGIYCPQADVYIDPWKPVGKAIITHAHSDHARPGSDVYLCQLHSTELLKQRLGFGIKVEGLEYGKHIQINGVDISLFPAGHIIGSAQVRLEYKGEIWVVSGDYKLTDDGISTPFEPVTCHHFITECTFGLPIYKFPDQQEVFDDMNRFWQDNACEGMNTVFIGYSLGKAQRIVQGLNAGIGPVFLHGAIANIHEALARQGFAFPGERVQGDTPKEQFYKAVIIAPTSALGSPWLKKFSPYRIGFCSGWMQLRGARRRRGVDRGFILSDHADWDQLNAAVKATGAQHIYATHGYQHVYAHWVREAYGLEGHEVQSFFQPVDSEDI